LELNENGNQTANHHHFYHDEDLTSNQSVLRNKTEIDSKRFWSSWKSFTK
jgi:hypothetical protein